MRLVPRIGLFGIALVAVVVMLGGCGGGSNSAARKLHAVLSAGCGESGIEDKLRGLVAGVLATAREFESSGSASHLAKICPDVVVLHDRRMPKSRANIDHIAIAPSGVFVIDAKRYKGRSRSASRSPDTRSWSSVAATRRSSSMG